MRPLRNKDFLLLQSSCSFFIGFCSSFDLLQNSQILDLFIFVLQPFLLQKSLHSSLLVLFVYVFNLSFLSSSVSEALCCLHPVL